MVRRKFVLFNEQIFHFFLTILSATNINSFGGGGRQHSFWSQNILVKRICQKKLHRAITFSDLKILCFYPTSLWRNYPVHTESTIIFRGKLKAPQNGKIWLFKTSPLHIFSQLWEVYHKANFLSTTGFQKFKV